MASDRVDLNEVGAKYDGEKLRWDLIPWDAMEEVAKVYTLGAKKYADRNWEKGIHYNRIMRALLGHAIDYYLRKDYDDDNGQHHMASVVWNALALLTYDKRGMKSFDDRPSVSHREPEKPWHPYNIHVPPASRP